MDVPPDVLEVLKCSSCELCLSRGPVYLEYDGAAACGRCYTPKRPAVRNTQYEATARLLKFPCKNRKFGCLKTVPYVEHDEVIEHEEVCEHRQYVCPVLGCDWLGPRAAMLAHCREQHPDSVLENLGSFTHDIARASLRNYIVTAFQMIFLLHTKVCVTSETLFHAVRLLGTSAEAAEYSFNLDIVRNNELLSKEGQVASEGCLAIQEPTSLAVNTNSLLDMLGGFDGVTFTVTVKRRVNDVAEQLTTVMKRTAVVKCAGCAVEVTEFLYRGEDGWRCERCAPARRACMNQRLGCTYTDIDKKRWKHGLYFCQHRTICYNCMRSVRRGSISAHYCTASNIDRYSSTWRATETGRMMWRCRLVSSVAGTAMCEYDLFPSRFDLRVHIPVSSVRLSEFRCKVRVTDPNTGHTLTFTPDVDYDAKYDWRIKVTRKEFPSLNTELNVCVEITKT